MYPKLKSDQKTLDTIVDLYDCIDETMYKLRAYFEIQNQYDDEQVEDKTSPNYQEIQEEIKYLKLDLKDLTNQLTNLENRLKNTEEKDF